MVIFNHFKHKHIGSHASLLILSWGSVPTCKTDEDVNEAVDCNILGMPSTTTLLLLRISGTATDMTRLLPIILATLKSSLQLRLFAKSALLKSHTGLKSGFATSHRG